MIAPVLYVIKFSLVPYENDYIEVFLLFKERKGDIFICLKSN